jgi:methionine-rich copper-binding protein CopC
VSDLIPGTAYYITVDSTALKDHSGQNFAGLTKANAIDFTATDPRPSLTHTNINQFGQFEYQSDLALNFSEKVVAGPGSIQLKTANGQLVETFNLTNLTGDRGGSVAFSFSSVHINPFADLTPGQSYVFNVDANALQDASGQFFTGQTTLPLTAINEPPRLWYSNPRDDSTVEPLQYMSFNFTETIQAGTGSIHIIQVGIDGIDTLVESFDVSTATTLHTGSERLIVGNVHRNFWMDLYLAQPLEAGYTYYVLIDPTAITDRSGMPFAGLSSPTALDFHVIDSPPALSWSSPGRFGTISPQDDLRLYFTEIVQVGSGNFILSDQDGNVVETFAIGGTTGSAGGSLRLWDNYSLTINPGQDLVAGQRYTLSQEIGTLFDSAQQTMVDLVGVNALSFSVTA